MHYNCVNEAMNLKKSSIEPIVGMCGTMFVGSDRYPVVVTEVMTNKKIRIELMSDVHYNTEKVLDNDGNEFLPKHLMKSYVNVDDVTMYPMGKVYTLRKNHRWMKVGAKAFDCGGVHLGHADEYRDPSF